MATSKTHTVGREKTWTQKNLDPEKPELWKSWTMKNSGNSWMQQKY